MDFNRRAKKRKLKDMFDGCCVESLDFNSNKLAFVMDDEQMRECMAAVVKVVMCSRGGSASEA